MFQFPRFPLRSKTGVPRLFIEVSCLIRKSPAELARQLTEAYRSHAASFIGPQCLGIHRAPLVALTTIPLPPQRVLGSLRSLSIRLLTCVASHDLRHSQKIGLMQADPPRCISESLLACVAIRHYQSKSISLRLDVKTFARWCRWSETFSRWWSRGDSNPRPPPCKGGALPAELRPHLACCQLSAISGGRWWTRTTDLGLIRTAL